MNRLIKQAFTLIELLVVIAIIGILSGLIVVSMGGMTTKASIAKAQVFSNSLRNSLMMNIIGEWKMDEGSGTIANDSWKKINNGTLIGFADTTAGYGDAHTSGWMSSSNCISGTCLKFDGSNDYVDIVAWANETYSNFTIGFWSKYDGVSNQMPIGNHDIAGAARGFIYFYQDSFYVLFDGDTQYYHNDYSLKENQWAYYSLSYDGVTIKLYVDGVVVGSAAKAYNLYNSFRFGWSYGTYWYKGIIDEVRVYNAVMPTSQIKEQYYAGISKLISNGSISQEEYMSRINSIAEAR